MKDKFKKNINQNLLSLNYKIEIPEKGNFFISSYNNKYITVNKIKFYLPLCLLGKQFYDLKIKNILMISSNFLNDLLNEFLNRNKVNAEVILIGLTNYDFQSLLPLKKKCENEKIPIDIMKYDAVCRTINILNSENRNIISILV